MLIDVKCRKCGKWGRARYNRGIAGISYSNWYCPSCRAKARKTGKLPKSSIRKSNAGCCSLGLIPIFILFFPFITFIPSKKVLMSLIKFHQKVISKKLSRFNINCCYDLSCSEYGKLAIIKYGAIKGGWKSINRIWKCRPSSYNSCVDYP